MRFTVRDFHDLAKFMKFSICKMFSPNRYKADFEQNTNILITKSIILNKVTKYTSTKSSIFEQSHKIYVLPHNLQYEQSHKIYFHTIFNFEQSRKFSSATFSHYVHNTHIYTL